MNPNNENCHCENHGDVAISKPKRIFTYERLMKIREKRKKILEILKSDYELTVSNSEFDKYLYLYGKHTLAPTATISQALDNACENPDNFAYLIFGIRAKVVLEQYKKGDPK